MAPPQDGTPQVTRSETGKQRALRIPLDYYKKSDGIQRAKVILTGVALAAGLGWWGVGLASREQSRLMYSHGPVAKVHAEIEADCTACHVLFHPITGQKGPALLVSDHHASDMRCEVCHGASESQRGSGSPHHKSQKKEDTNSCGGCHRDHQGRDFSLVHVADTDCTSCHRDLKTHMNGTPQFHNAVSDFAKDHPQFAALKTEGDPGKLRFNHNLHMAAGLFPDGSPESGFTYDRLAEADRVLYGWKPGEDLKKPVQLDCANCHQTAAKGPGVNIPDEPYGPGVAKRLDGAYMQPITYENQCRACHPITDHLNNPLPHRLQPPELQKELNRALTGSGAKKEAGPRAEKRPVPGNSLSVRQAKEDTAEDQMRKAQRFLYLGRANCGECHFYDIPKGKVVPESITAPGLVDVWFPRALFNHKKHDKMTCRECHANAYHYKDDQRTGVNPQASKQEKDILVPGVENCKQCHAPGGNTAFGKAGSDCTECHRYHHGDQGIMASRKWPDRHDTAEVLRKVLGDKQRPLSR